MVLRTRSAIVGATLLGMLLVAVPAWSQSDGKSAPTYSADIAPILQRSCQSCHRAGEIAPMSLMTYKEVRPWARAMKRQTASRSMPPWHYDKTIGVQHLKDDPSLSDAEIDMIARWADAGAPEGNPTDVPKARAFKNFNDWQIGEPDMVVKFPAYPVPAAGPDLYGDLLAEIPIEEDRYIQAIQTRSATPESHKVVHHALSYAVSRDAVQKGMAGEGGAFLVEYASGKNAEVYPEGTGVLLQKGQMARLSYHLHSVGKETRAEVELGIKFYPKGFVPKHVRWSRQLAQPTSPLDIPANTIARSDGYTQLHKPARIIAFQPHMHNLGKRQCLELIYPSSGTRMNSEIVSCANFNNNWHLTYNYADDTQPLVPAGTVLHNIQWHDNTKDNPRALDPKNWVGDGQRTIDEMGFFWVGWIELTEEEYQQQLAERRERQKRATSSDAGQQQQR